MLKIWLIGIKIKLKRLFPPLYSRRWRRRSGTFLREVVIFSRPLFRPSNGSSGGSTRWRSRELVS